MGRGWPSFSVAAKIGSVFVLLSLIFSALLLVNFYLTQQWLGAGSAMRYADSQRMRIYRIAFLLNDMTTPDEEARRSVLQDIQQMDRVLLSLKEGDPSFGLPPESERDVLVKLAALEHQWVREVKPTIEESLHARSASSTLYNPRVSGFVDAWSDLVDTLERRTARRIDMLYHLQWSLLVCTAVLLALTMWVLRRAIQDPLKKLTTDAEQMALGRVPTSTASPSRDEFGRLAATFEWMAGRLTQHSDHLEALHLTGQEIVTLEAGGLEQVLGHIVDRAAGLLKADLAILLVRHPMLDYWVIEAASGQVFDRIRKQVLLFDETPLATQMFETRAPIFVNDLSQHADKRIRFRDEFGAKSYMAVPVFGPQEELMGVLVLLQTSVLRVFTDWDVQLTRPFCSYAAVTIAHARLLEAVEAESSDLKDQLRAVERTIADLTHEVKAPAGRVAEFASWIVKDYRERLDERAIRYLEWIQKEGHDLLDLAEQTLDVARLSQERRVESADVGSVVRDLIDLHAPALAAKGIDITVSNDLPLVACRRIHVKQVFDNLIDNAIKYMGAQPSPHIEIGLRGDLLYVRDNGVGMDPAMTERIFQPFHRLRTIDAPGAGLGLSIVKTVVEHYGGEITVTSKPGDGTTFFLRLPILLKERAAHVEAAAKRKRE